MACRLAWLHSGLPASLAACWLPGRPADGALRPPRPIPPTHTPCCSPPGTYSKAGSRTCVPCPPGTFNKTPLQGQCTPATAGSFATGSGNKAQTSCPKGSYQNHTGQATCIKCPINTYQALTGKTVCSSCCKAGTVLGKTCFLWTRGLKGQASCASTRSSGKLLL